MRSPGSRIRTAFGADYGERGASMVEYALLVLLIAIVAFATVQVFGENLSTTYSDISAGFDPPAN